MKLYLIGAGGHAKVVLSALLEAGLRVDGLFDDDPQKQGVEILGVPVIGTVSDAKRKGPARGVLAIGDNRTRYRLAQEFAGWEWVPIIHPEAYVHPSVRLGPGSVVFAGAVIQPEAQIGAHVIVNTGATVDHDCRVGDFVHLAPGVHLAGNATVEEGAFIGMGAVLVPGVKVGAWAVVGAGAVVLEEIPPRMTAVGMPARPIKTIGNGREL